MNDSAARFEALAASVLGRPIRVVWSDDGSPTSTDGHTIALDPNHAALARHAVLVQSALLAGGALRAERIRPLRGRPRRVEAYLRAEVPACLARMAHRLPPVTWPEPTGVREDWWGTITPGPLLRMATVEPPPDDKVDVIGEPPDDPEGDPPSEDGGAERSRFGRRTVDQGRRRRKKGRGSGRRTSSGEASIGRAVLGTSSAQVPRIVGRGDQRVLEVEVTGRVGEIARYPEWDEGRDTYREDWCHVHEVHPHGDATALTDVGTAEVRRNLARVHLDLATFRRQPAGADLDLDAVLDHRIAVRSGFDGPAHVFRDVRRARRDLGVLILVDGSGSTGRSHATGPSVTDRQRAAAAALVDAFESLGDRVSCAIFRSHGRKRVELTTVKGFDERSDGTTRARLAALRPEGFTRLGAAVRHGTRLLIDRSGSRRWLLVVLSDGFPFDEGYETRYASADVAMALTEAQRSGVGALCLGIGTTTPDIELQAVFGASTYATGPTMSELGADLADLVRAALDGADRSRRIKPA